MMSVNLSCNRGLWGTNTGNPGVRNGTDAMLPGITGYYSENLASRMCVLLGQCYPSMDATLCNQEILKVNAIAIELSVSNKYNDLGEIVSAEKAGTLNVNAENATSCLKVIQSLACSDSNVQSAYDSNQPNQFDNTYFLIRASGDCAQSFQ